MNEAIQHSDDSTGPEDDRRRARFVWLSEITFAVGFLLVVFGFLSALIRAYFPQGTSLIVDPDASVLTDVSWSGDVLPNSDVTLQPRTAGDDVEFLITVNDDQSTTVNVHEGTAQVGCFCLRAV